MFNENFLATNYFIEEENSNQNPEPSTIAELGNAIQQAAQANSQYYSSTVPEYLQQQINALGTHSNFPTLLRKGQKPKEHAPYKRHVFQNKDLDNLSLTKKFFTENYIFLEFASSDDAFEIKQNFYNQIEITDKYQKENFSKKNSQLIQLFDKQVLIKKSIKSFNVATINSYLERPQYTVTALHTKGIKKSFKDTLINDTFSYVEKDEIKSASQRELPQIIVNDNQSDQEPSLSPIFDIEHMSPPKINPALQLFSTTQILREAENIIQNEILRIQPLNSAMDITAPYPENSETSYHNITDILNTSSPSPNFSNINLLDVSAPPTNLPQVKKPRSQKKSNTFTVTSKEFKDKFSTDNYIVLVFDKGKAQLTYKALVNARRRYFSFEVSKDSSKQNDFILITMKPGFSANQLKNFSLLFDSENSISTLSELNHKYPDLTMKMQTSIMNIEAPQVAYNSTSRLTI